MKTAFFYGPEDLRLEDIPTPSCGPGEVLVKIAAALTCGTDFKSYRRGHPVIFKSLPSPFGHEMAGTIAEVGDGVTQFSPGMRVVPANSAPCGSCFHCDRSEFSLCEDLLFLNGAYSDYLIIPRRIVRKNLHVIPRSLSFETAALAEPLACAVHAVERLQIKAGEYVVVIGTGPMSLLLTQVLKEKGARIAVIGRTWEKLRHSERAGAEMLASALDGDPSAKIKTWAHAGQGPDVVIEAVGQPETWEQAVALVRRGGRVCPFGGCSRGSVFKGDTFRFHYDEVRLVGVFHHTPDCFREAIRLLIRGVIDPHLLIVGRKRLSAIGEIFYPGVTDTPLKIAVIP